MSERVIWVTVTVRDFLDGRQVSATTLRREGPGSGLTAEEHVTLALEFLARIADDPVVA